MTEQLMTYLHELELTLRTTANPILHHLNEGLIDSEIASFEKQMNIEFYSDIYALYRWRNGTAITGEATIGEQSLFSSGIFYSLQDVVNGYNYFYSADHLKKGMLPIFGSGGGDYFFVNTNHGTGTFGMVFLYSPTLFYSEVPVSYCDSLVSLFACISYCYQDGIYSASSKGDGLQIDYDREQEVFRKHNPNSHFWRS
jgi:hypothetical protein